MRRSKVLLGAAVLVTAACTSFFSSATARASEEPIEEGKVTIDSARQLLTVDKEVLGPGKNRQIYFGIAKVSVNAKERKGTVTAPAKWDIYDTADNSDSLTISLASLKNTVDNYIQIKGSEDEIPVTIKIPKVVSYKAVYDPLAEGGEKVFRVVNAKKANNMEIPYGGDKVFYRTPHGSWKEVFIDDVDADTFAIYQEQGATLYFRVPAGTESIEEDKTIDYYYKTKSSKETPTSVTVQQAGSFASAEFKMAVAKREDAKPIKVDYLKGTFVLPVGFAYRCNPLSLIGNGKFKDKNVGTANKNIPLADGIAVPSETSVLELRREAVTTGKKKIASKIAQLQLDYPEKPFAEGLTGENGCCGKMIGAIMVGMMNGNKLTFENTSETDIYQLLVKKDAAAKGPDDAKASWVNIPKATTTNGKTKYGSLTLTIPDGSELFLRTKGDAKTKKFTSAYASLGKVKSAASPDADISKAVTEMKTAGFLKAENGKIVLPTTIDGYDGVKLAWTSSDRRSVSIDVNNTASMGILGSNVFLTAAVSKGSGNIQYVKFSLELNYSGIIGVKKGVTGEEPSGAIDTTASDNAAIASAVAALTESTAFLSGGGKKAINLPAPKNGTIYNWKSDNYDMLSLETDRIYLPDTATDGTVTFQVAIRKGNGTSKVIEFTATISGGKITKVDTGTPRDE